MIYVAAPFTNIDKLKEKTNFLLTEAFVLHLMKERSLLCFSPVVYTYKMAVDNNWPTDAAFYMQFNMDMLRHAQAMFLLRLPGWQESKGVTVERGVCKMLQIPIAYFNPDYSEVTEDGEPVQ